MTTEHKTPEQQAEAARAMIKAVHEDKCATINGRDYQLTSINHIKRRKVFAFFSRIQGDLQRGDFWWLDSKDWAEVEKVIENCVTYNGDLISRRERHWEEFPQDYILFVQTMLGALSFPFLPENAGD